MNILTRSLVISLITIFVTACGGGGGSSSSADTTAPVITLLGLSTVNVEQNTTYTDEGATASDNADGVITGNITPTSTVNTNAVGTYTVTYNVSDAAGNAATAVVRTVIVADTTVPVITLIGSSTVNLELGSTYTDAGATASDNTDGVLDGSITPTSTVNTGAVGTYTVTYNVSDASGNAATAVVRTVNITADITIPVITLTGSSASNVEQNTTYTDEGATASDNADGVITGNITPTSTVNTNAVGTYTVTYNVSDAAGNAAVAVVRTINVTDNSFNIGAGMNSEVWTIAPATDDSGDVYVGGFFSTVNGSTSNRLVRMNSDGSVDAGFDLTGGGMSKEVQSIAPATDGSGDVYVGGWFTTVNGSASNGLVRMNSDGSVDSAFDLTGGGMNFIVRSIAPTTDGSGDVYVGGNFTTVNGSTSNYLVRMNSDGSVDTGFDLTAGGMNSDVWTIAPATDGSGDVYVGGWFTTVNGSTSNRLVRMNSDGSVDTGFDLTAGGINSTVLTIAPATDGSGDVYVGGGFTTVNGSTSNRLVRMNSDGSVDTGFDLTAGGMNSSVRSIAPATDGSGDVYVGGAFTTVNGVASNRLVRMNSDGSVDSDFNLTGGGINSTVLTIAPATDGSGDVYVGGGFTTVNTITSNRLVGMNPDGTVE